MCVFALLRLSKVAKNAIVQKQTLGEGETKQTFDGQLFQEYSYQN